MHDFCYLKTNIEPNNFVVVLEFYFILLCKNESHDKKYGLF